MEQQASIPPPLDQTIGRQPSAPSILKPVDPHRTEFNQRNFQDVNPPSYSRSVASPPLHTPTRYKDFEPPAADIIIRYRFVWVADAIGKVAGNGGSDSFFRVMKTPHAETFGNKGITIAISPSPLLGREHPCIVDVRCKSLRLLFTCRYDPDAKDFSHFVFTRDEKGFEENGLNAHTQNVAFTTCSISMAKNHINQPIEVCDENGNKFLFMMLDVGLDENGRRTGSWYYAKRVLDDQPWENCAMMMCEKKSLPWLMTNVEERLAGQESNGSDG